MVTNGQTSKPTEVFNILTKDRRYQEEVGVIIFESLYGYKSKVSKVKLTLPQPVPVITSERFIKIIRSVQPFEATTRVVEVKTALPEVGLETKT